MEWGRGVWQMARDQLTTKQRAFVEAYLANGFNASAAALTAGYKTRQSGDENVSNPVIAALIQQRITDMTMRADEALLRLSDMARADMSDFVSMVGTMPYLDLEKAKGHHKLHLLKKFKVTDKGVEIELYDAQAALVHILKEQHLAAGEPTERNAIEDGHLTNIERANRLAAILDAGRDRRDGRAPDERLQ